MTRRITSYVDQVKNGAFTRSIPLGGQIVKQSYITFINENDQLPETTVATSREFALVNNQYLLAYGDTARFMPQVSSFQMVTANQYYPSGGGLLRWSAPMLYQYTALAQGKKMRYPVHRYASDKFYTVLQYGSLDLARVPEAINVQGSVVKDSGNFGTLDIVFNDIAGNSLVRMYIYTEAVQLIHINSKGDLKVER